MNEAQKAKLEEYFEKLGMDHIKINAVLGGMVFVDAEWGGIELEAVFNISSSSIVYRKYNRLCDCWTNWQEV